MMKFFRKHTKKLLAIFMSLLLVVWLGGAALRSWLAPEASEGDVPIAEAFGETVLRKDTFAAGREAEMLSSLGLAWQAAWSYPLTRLTFGRTQPDADQLRGFLMRYERHVRHEPLDKLEWYMLTTEARRNRVYVSPEAVTEFKEQWGISGPLLAAVRDRHRTSVERIDEAIRSLVQVQEQAILASKAAQISEADVQHSIRQARERARISVIALEAKRFLDKSKPDEGESADKPYEPAEEELTAHFERYRDVPAQIGSGLVFGYQLPEAVKIEYIRVNADALVKRQPDPETANAEKYFKDHKPEFTRPTDPSKTEKREPYPYFLNAEPEVIARMKRDAARAEARQIADDLIRDLGKGVSTMPATGPAGDGEAPASQPVDSPYAELVRQLGAKEGKYPDESLFVMRRGLERDLNHGVLSQALWQAFADHNIPLGSLATIPLDFERDLNGGSISEELGQQLQRPPARLSKNATLAVAEKGRRWLISDEGRQFAVIKEADTLHVCASGFQFSIPLEHEKDLNDTTLSDGLKKELRTHRVFLTPEAVVSVEEQGGRWLIKDSQRDYAIVKEGDALNTYWSDATISTEEPGRKWVVQEKGRRYVVLKEEETLKTYRPALEYVELELMDGEAWSEKEELKQIRATGGKGRPITLEEAAFLVKGLEGASDVDRNLTRFVREVKETCGESFVDPDGNAYVFRTVEIRPRQTPTLEVLRDQLVEDLKLLHAHEEAGRQAKALAERAGMVGLKQAFEENKELSKKLGSWALRQPRPLARSKPQASISLDLEPELSKDKVSAELWRALAMQGASVGWEASISVQERGRRWRIGEGAQGCTVIKEGDALNAYAMKFAAWEDPEAVKRCFELAGRTTTQPSRVVAEEQRWGPRWLVIQWHEIMPVELTAEDYKKERAAAIRRYRAQRQLDVLSDWFDPERIHDRVGWKDAPGPDGDREAG